MTLSDSALKNVSRPAKGYRLFRDDKLIGFGAKVFASGTVVYCVNYVVDGRERRMSIGRAPKWTAVAARSKARELLRKADLGDDPLAARQTRKKEPTFADLIAEYELVHLPKTKRARDAAARLSRDVVPPLGGIKLSKLSKRDIISVVEKKAGKAPTSANRTLTIIKAVLNFGVRRDWLTHSPAALIERPAPERPRERVLTYDEIKALWEVLQSLGSPVARILQLTLLTACRPGEIARMRWSDIDGSWFNIAASRTKASRAHRVPLTSLAMGLLETIKRTESEFVFPTRYGYRHGPVGEAAASMLLRRREWFGLEPWQPRDLRRTAATHMAELGVAPFIIDRVLNHADPSVRARHYAHYEYDREKSAAMEIWERKLRSTLTGEKAAVVEFG